MKLDIHNFLKTWIVENEQNMKELCPIRFGKLFGLGSFDPYLVFDNNLRYICLFGMKLVPLESRLKDISNNIWIIKMDLK